MELGDVIRRLREDRDWDQLDLAKAADMSQQAISKIERGLVREPRSVARIAHAFGISVDKLLAMADSKPVTGRKKPPPKPRVRRRQTRWPFSFPYEDFLALDEREKKLIEGAVWAKYLELEAERKSTRRAGSRTKQKRDDRKAG
jgi:transcriptional regulator with XRE-family HTH domain